MKIQLYDVSHIINQIKRANPPKDKETHKFLNNLAILLEKNTIKKNSTLESTLISTSEKFNETFLDLCFKRKEMVKRFSQEYLETVDNAYIAINNNSKALETFKNDFDVSIDWNLKTMAESSNELMPQIFSKLQKARSIIEDGLERNESVEKEMKGNFELFFNEI